MLDPLLGNQFPFVTVFLAVLFTAWYGGLGPAISAVVFGALVSTYFLNLPRGSFALGTNQLVGLLVYLGTSGGIALLGGAMDRSRRKAEALAESAQRQAALIDQTYDAILVWDWNGPIVFWNSGAERIYGFSEADAVGRVSHDLLETERPGGVQHFVEILEREGRWEGELEHLTRDGRRITVESRMVLVRDHGTPYVLEANRDITKRRRAEQALREANEQLESRVQERTAELTQSEERFRLLVEGTEDYAIFMLDAEGIIQTWNSGAAHIEGFQPAEIIGKPYSSLFTSEDLASGKPERQLRQAAEDGKVDVEGWRVRKDGSRFWVTGTLMALYDGNHAVKAFTKIARDLTERRRTDELLRSVLDNTLDGIVSINEKGTVSLFNLAGEKMFGRTASEVVGQNVRVLVPEPYQSQHDGYLEGHMRKGEAKVVGKSRKVVGLRKDGSTFSADLAITEFVLDGQRQFVGIVRDISETQRLEDQLRQAQKLEAVGQLAGGIAHDFNNLLGIVIGSAEMLQSDLPKGSELREYTADVLNAAHRAAELTRQLLAFGRQQILQPKVLSLNALIQEFEKMLRRVIPESIEIRTALGSVGRVRVDAGQIEQVIMNLVVNARDAMGEGGRLTIETADVELDEQYATQHPTAKAGRYVMVAVSDTGHGMTPEVQARIFDPFYTTKARGKGTGLGLGVVHGIVKQSGGSIYVYSEPGRGTTFKVYVPHIEDEAEISTRGFSTAEMPRGDETILVAEDEAGLRKIVSELLKGLGYTVLLAEHGADALLVSEAHDGPIHLLVTDVVMPGIGGRELADRLVRSRPALRTLYLSGYTDDSVIAQGVFANEMTFLQKPFAGVDLAQKVRDVLEASPRS